MEAGASWRAWIPIGCALLGWLLSLMYVGADLGASMSGLDPHAVQLEPPSPVLIAVPVGLIVAALALGARGRRRAPVRSWLAIAIACAWLVLATTALVRAMLDPNR